MPTIRDVARQANVSISTVSHVINDTRFVAPATRERVLEAIRDLNYKHNRIASSLRNQKTQTFGVLLPNSANPYFAEVLAGIEDAAYAHNYNIILGNAHDDPEREISYVQVLLSRQVDGILLISTGAHQQSLELTAESNTPVVLVDRSAHVDGVDEIFTDNLGEGVLLPKPCSRWGIGALGVSQVLLSSRPALSVLRVIGRHSLILMRLMW
jgi:LacI family transcriptional regulator